MKTWQTWEMSKFFGGKLPKFYGQGELTQDELEREESVEQTMHRRYAVFFDIEKGYHRSKMLRHFDKVAEIVDYMRKWGLGITDLDVIHEHDWHFDKQVDCWCVLCYDPFYGTVSSANGVRRRFYFPTEAEADAWADKLGKNWVVFDIYPTTRRVRFDAPYGNDVRVPFNNR